MRQMTFKWFLKILCITAALLIAVQTSKAQQWTQIKPLHSTRLEVERILGLPTERNNLTYNLPNERITIVYSDGVLCREDWPFGWNVPADVVLSVYVYPKTKLSLADLNFDLKNFQKDEQPNGTLYRNEVDGIWIESEKFNSEIKSITLAGGSSDKALHCPAVAQREEKLKSGEYALLRPFLYYLVSSQNQKSYWNFFGASLLQELKKEPKTMGYAISYAGQSACKDEASVRAKKVKQYLVSRFRIPSDNIVLIDGGYKQEPGIEFYIVPPGDLKPLPSPQIHPSKITIAGDKKCSKVLLTQNFRATPGH
jgi:hypothetical protein